MVPDIPEITGSVFSLARFLPVPSNDFLNPEFSGVCSCWTPAVVVADHLDHMAIGGIKECSICNFKSLFLDKYAPKEEDCVYFAETTLPWHHIQ